MSGHLDAAFGWSVDELAEKGLPCDDCGRPAADHALDWVCDGYVPNVGALCERCRGTGVEPADPTEPGTPVKVGRLVCHHCYGRGWRR